MIAQSLQGQPDTERESAAEESLFKNAEGDLTWKHGVIEHFNFQPEDEGEEPMHVVLERVLKHPAGHFIQKLTLGLPPKEDSQWHMEDLAKAIANAGPLPFLAELDMSPDAERKMSVNYQFDTMIEIPRAALTADHRDDHQQRRLHAPGF